MFLNCTAAGQSLMQRLQLPAGFCAQVFCVYVSAQLHLIDQRLRLQGTWEEQELQQLLGEARSQEAAAAGASSPADALVDNSGALQVRRPARMPCCLRRSFCCGCHPATRRPAARMPSALYLCLP